MLNREAVSKKQQKFNFFVMPARLRHFRPATGGRNTQKPRRAGVSAASPIAHELIRGLKKRIFRSGVAYNAPTMSFPRRRKSLPPRSPQGGFFEIPRFARNDADFVWNNMENAIMTKKFK